MWLRELQIRNFRKIEDLTVTFPRGLTVLVGENNSGKTAIMDALRLILFSSREFDSVHISENDFRDGTDFAPIEISARFTDLDDEDEAHFQECLVDVGGGKFEMQVSARVSFNASTNRPSYKMRGGETEGGTLPSNHYDRFAAVYLQPLRDPERGLRPGQHSQISRLVDSLTAEEQHEDFEKIAQDANERIRNLPAVVDAKTDIDTQMASVAGSQLAQKTELVFSDPTFRRIIAGLHPEIEGLPFWMNGLGYNNLVFSSATLSTLRHSKRLSHRSILIEEPEAHLHPQLQVLFLRHLNSVSQDPKSEVQVIASSHSPILASQAPIDSIVAVIETTQNVATVSMSEIQIDDKLKKKLQRFLDATRGELFFARRILMVEGIAEALLLPILAKHAGGCLKDSAVTVLNTDGINFNAFIPLFGEKTLSMPVAILTDGDASEVGGKASDAARGLKTHETSIPNLAVEMSEITFEHELARSDDIRPHMVAAFKELHPKKGKELETTLLAAGSSDEKADAFLKMFEKTGTSKGQYAQELAGILENSSLKADEVPEYIRNALAHLGVLKTEADSASN